MTPYDRGDVVLISYPVNDSLEMHLRPALVLHTMHKNDAAVAVAPIAPEPSAVYNTIHVAQGTFEAARLGLLTSGYLTACNEVIVGRQFVVKKLGRCPWQLLNEFMDMMRQPLIKRATAHQPESVRVAEGLAQEAV